MSELSGKEDKLMQEATKYFELKKDFKKYNYKNITKVR